MIQLVESKDVQWLVSEIEKINDRTKIHTIKIKELEKLLKGSKK